MYTTLIIISLQLLPNGMTSKVTQEITPMTEAQCFSQVDKINQLAIDNYLKDKKIVSITCSTKGET